MAELSDRPTEWMTVWRVAWVVAFVCLLVAIAVTDVPWATSSVVALALGLLGPTAWSRSK